MDTSTPFTHPPDTFCPKCGAKDMIIKELKEKVARLEKRLVPLEMLERQIGRWQRWRDK